MTPDRIWADPPEIFDGCDIWCGWPNERGTEYIRADLIPAMIAEAVAKEREACAKIVEPLSTGEHLWKATKPNGQPKLRFDAHEVKSELKWISRVLAAAIRNRKNT